MVDDAPAVGALMSESSFFLAMVRTEPLRDRHGHAADQWVLDLVVNCFGRQTVELGKT